MSSLAKSGISISKKDLSRSRIPPVASRNIAFYHKATLGQITINLLSLSMPSEMPTNVQATAAEISGAQLYNNRKNLDLVSSSKGPLIQGLDYIVSSGTTIALIGAGYTTGAELDEIFVGTINAAPISDLVVASAKSVVKTYSLAVGQNILNLGLEYQTNVNPLEKVGVIKVWVGGVLAIRGEDYAEVDAGSGYGTTISFYAAPATIPYQVVVDFGVMSITDNNAIGTIQSLSSSVLALANDLAIVAGSQASDYYSASPSDIERRTFGDSVLTLLNRMAAEESKVSKIAILTDERASGVSGDTSATSYTARTLNTLSDPDSVVLSFSANTFTLPAGRYFIEARSAHYAVGYHKIRLFNVNTTSVALLGSAGFSAPNGSSTDRSDTASEIIGHLNISASQVFRIEARAQFVVGSGWGAPPTFGDAETYLQVKITKIS